MLEAYIKYRIKPLFDREENKSNLAGLDPKLNQQSISEFSQVSDENSAMSQRLSVFAQNEKSPKATEFEHSFKQFSVWSFTPKIGIFATQNMLKIWDAAEKFVQRVFFSEHSNLKTANAKIRG